MQLLAKPTVPTVVVGLGKPGVMLSLLGKKIGAPFTYAALERGMEAYPEQPTARDLRDVYSYDDIGSKTPLIGVTGLTEREYVMTGAINRGMKQLGVSARCLPVQVGNVRLFQKVMEIAGFKAVVVNEPWRHELLEAATDLEPAAQQSQAVDLLVNEDKSWNGYNLLWRAAGAALDATLRQKYPTDKPLDNRMVAIVGADASARSLALGIKSRGGIPIIVSRDRDNAREAAKEIGCRYIPFEQLYTTSHNVLIVCVKDEFDPMQGRKIKTQIHPGYLKPSITVMDLTSMPDASDLQIEAVKRGCDVVTPRRVLLEQILLSIRLITDQDVPRESIEASINEFAPEER
jgi:3-dehydroquinate dehydratase/shikimate dehydrogenase